MSSLTEKCPNVDKGCSFQTDNLTHMNRHSKLLCPDRTIICPQMNCHKTITLNVVMDHLKTDHECKEIEAKGAKFSLEWDTEAITHLPIIVNLAGTEVRFLAMTYSLGDRNFCWLVSLTGLQEEVEITLQ